MSTQRQISLDYSSNPDSYHYEKKRSNSERSTRSRHCSANDSGRHGVRLSQRSNHETSSGYESLDTRRSVPISQTRNPMKTPTSPPPSYGSICPEFVELPSDDEAYVTDSYTSAKSSNESFESSGRLPCAVIDYPVATKKLFTKHTRRNGDSSPPDIMYCKSKGTYSGPLEKVIVDGQFVDYLPLPSTSPVQAQNCLKQFAKDGRTRSTKFAKKCEITNIMPNVAFRYKVSSFSEFRDIVDKSRPWQGGQIDLCKAAKISRWAIEAPQPTFFHDRVYRTKIPHTEVKKVCKGCNGSGSLTCSHCHGSRNTECHRCCGSGMIEHGGQSCGQCSGGRNTCRTCSGRGDRTCGPCQGKGKLIFYKELVVTWKTFSDTYVDDIKIVPKAKIEKVRGCQFFCDQAERLDPLKEKDILHENIRRFSKCALEKQYRSSQKILRQKHVVDLVPVQAVDCKYKNTFFKYYLIGVNLKVYAPKYPGNAFGIANLFRPG